MTRRAQTRPHAVEPADRLLAEAVRAYEEDGSSPLREQDADTTGRQAGGDLEHRLVVRARALSASGPLREALRHVRQATSLIVVGGVVLAALAGAATARAALSGEPAAPLNFFWVLGGVLGVQTVVLLLWVGLVLVGPGAMAAGSLGGGVLALGRWLARKLNHDRHHLAAIQAAGSIFARGSIGRWTLGSISHGLWTAFNLGCLLLVVLMLSARHYTFTWETTILSAPAYAGLTSALGFVPDLLGFATPTPEQIAASEAPAEPAAREAARQAWSGLLVGSLVLYGLAPRLLLLGFCLGRGRLAYRRYRLDTLLPGYLRLEPQLRPDPRLGVVDGESAHESPGFVDRPPARSQGTPRPAGSPAVVGFEIERPASSWPPPIDGVRWHDLGFVDGRDDSRRVIDELVSSSDEPQVVVIVCALTTTPDRGIGGFIAEVRQAVSGPVGLVLTAGHALRRRGDTAQVSHRVEDWGRLAAAAGLTSEVIELDLDHLTDASLAKLAGLVGAKAALPTPPRRIEGAVARIVEHVERWSVSGAALSAADRAELHRQIAALHRDEHAGWRQLFGPTADPGGDVAGYLKTGADRVVGLLPQRLKLNPRWLAAGAMTGALGCVAAATLLSPVAIAALPMWSGLGAALAAVVGMLQAGAGDDRCVPTADLTDAVCAAGLFSVLLELQGRDEAEITDLLDRIVDADETVEIDTPDAARQWLGSLVRRYDAAVGTGRGAGGGP